MRRDNSNLESKLLLRRTFLRQFHSQPPSILDCCQGSGLLWSILRTEFPINQYVGLDIKPRPGRLAIDSIRFLAKPGWSFDVIDIDIYGSPFRHWLAMLPNVREPLTVFLTIGQAGHGIDTALRRQAGTGSLRIIPGLWRRLFPWLCEAALGVALGHRLTVIRAAESPPSAHARYLAIRLAPTEISNP